MHVQSDSLSLASGALEFAGQSSHTSNMAPTTVEFLPFTQLLHAESPGAILYFPAMQVAQVPPMGPDEPALHTQAVAITLPNGELEFSGHISHATFPDNALYFPNTQAVHSPPLGPTVWPAAHMHTLDVVLIL